MCGKDELMHDAKDREHEATVALQLALAEQADVRRLYDDTTNEFAKRFEDAADRVAQARLALERERGCERTVAPQPRLSLSIVQQSDVPQSDFDRVNEWFTYHAPRGDQVERYNAIRESGRELAHVILAVTPRSADRSAAIRKVREAVMTANAGIACGGES